METTVQTKKKRSLGIAIVLGVVTLWMIFFYLLPKVIRPAKRYEQAQTLLAAERYEDALAIYEILNGYKDSAAQADKCKNELAYVEAVSLYEAGQYDGALAAFTALIGYRDSAAQIEKCQYALRDRAYDAALALRKAAQYEEAISAFLALGGHRDCVEQIELCKKDRAYDAAVALYDAGKYEDAIAAFETLNGYRDSVTKIEQVQSMLDVLSTLDELGLADKIKTVVLTETMGISLYTPEGYRIEVGDTSDLLTKLNRLKKNYTAIMDMAAQYMGRGADSVTIYLYSKNGVVISPHEVSYVAASPSPNATMFVPTQNNPDEPAVTPGPNATPDPAATAGPDTPPPFNQGGFTG